MVRESLLLPSGRRRGMAVVVLLSVLSVPALLIAGLCAAYSFSELEQARADNALALTYSSNRLEHAPETIARLRSRLQDGSIYTETSPTAAASRFSQLLQSGLRGAGAEVRSVDPQPVQVEPGLERLQVAFDLTVRQDRLPHVMATLERLRPLVFTDSLNISGTSLGQAAGVLWVRMKLSSFRRVPDAAG
jgi:hypothetical protein